MATELDGGPGATLIAPAPQQATASIISGGVLARVRARLPRLTPVDTRVANYILARHTDVVDLSVSDVAAAAGTAASSVVRCCQRLGFKGFHELKLALAREAGQIAQLVTGDVAEDDPPGTVLRKTFGSQGRAIGESLATLDEAVFGRAVAALAGAGRVLFVGVGTSAPLAQDAAYRFQTIGIDASAPPDVHVQHVRARLLTPVDACFAISHTGATRETVATIGAAQAAGATTLAVTSFAHSPLIDLVDVALVAGSGETHFRLEAMASRIVHLVVLDALFIALGLRLGAPARAALDAYGEVIAEHRY